LNLSKIKNLSLNKNPTTGFSFKDGITITKESPTILRETRHISTTNTKESADDKSKYKEYSTNRTATHPTSNTTMITDTTTMALKHPKRQYPSPIMKISPRSTTPIIKSKNQITKLNKNNRYTDNDEEINIKNYNVNKNVKVCFY